MYVTGCVVQVVGHDTGCMLLGMMDALGMILGVIIGHVAVHVAMMWCTWS